MFQGKTKAALDLLAHKGCGSRLNLQDTIDTNSSVTVKEILREKHPPAQGIQPSALMSTVTDDPPHPVLFEQIDGALIRKTALGIQGASGPSGLDAYSWRRLCTGFGEASDSLCSALALTARRLCTEHIDSLILAPWLSCRLIALDKCPGNRPIGIQTNIKDAVGLFQLCAGHTAGVEAAVHTVQELFSDQNSEAVLLVDSKNALN